MKVEVEVHVEVKVEVKVREKVDVKVEVKAELKVHVKVHVKVRLETQVEGACWTGQVNALVGLAMSTRTCSDRPAATWWCSPRRCPNGQVQPPAGQGRRLLPRQCQLAADHLTGL